MNRETFRVVTRGADGEIRTRDYDSQEALLKRHSQVGVDDCSTDLGLRGLPVFRGLIELRAIEPASPCRAVRSNPFGLVTLVWQRHMSALMDEKHGLKMPISLLMSKHP